MTAALEGGEWSTERSGCTLPPGKTRYSFNRKLRGSQGRSGRAENLFPTGIRSWTLQPVVSRYTDWATRPTPSFITIPNYSHNSQIHTNTPFFSWFIPGTVRGISLLSSVQTDSGTKQPPTRWVSGTLSPRSTWPVPQARHSPLYGA